jgi:hypothetical protein
MEDGSGQTSAPQGDFPTTSDSADRTLATATTSHACRQVRKGALVQENAKYAQIAHLESDTP